MDKKVDPASTDTDSSCDGNHTGSTATLEVPTKSFFKTNPEQSGRYKAYLEITGSEEKTGFPLPHEDIFIGRSSECHIVLLHKEVSRKHATVLFKNEEYQLKDLDSKNGVYLNGIKVLQCTLRNGDQISLGGFVITFYEGY